MKQRSPTPTLSTAELEVKARQLVAQGKYRDAITTYRQLTSLEPRPEWREALTLCYAERARELQQKNMPGEALIMWESHFQWCDVIHADSATSYLTCLLSAGKIAKACQFYLTHQSCLEKHPAAKRVSTRFALGVLLGEHECRKTFDATTTLGQQAAHASKALEAYCAGQDAEMEEALSAISFRSPLKDFSLLLKAMATLPNAPSQARDMLAKIPADSVFSALAEQLTIGTLSGASLARGIAGLATDFRALIGELKGWNKPQLQLLQEVSRLGDKPSPAEQLKLLCAQKDGLIDVNRLRAASLAALVSFPKGIKAFETRFGKLSAFQKAQLQAQSAEQCH